MKLFSFSVAVCWALIGHTVGKEMRTPIGDPATSTSYVEMASVFSSAPASGFAVIRVTVRNDTSQPLSFVLDSVSRQARYREDHVTKGHATLNAPANQTSTHELLLPVCAVPADGSGYSYGRGQQRLEVNLNGSANTHAYLYEEALNEPAETAAFTKALTTDNIKAFNDDDLRKMPSGQTREFAVQFDHQHLPTDWRACSGFDYVSLSAPEWLELSASGRASLLQWVELGGILTLYTPGEETPAMLQLKLPSKLHDDYGLGRVRLLKWSGQMLSHEQLRLDYPPASNSGSEVPPGSNLAHGERGNFWDDLQKAFGERSFAAWQIGLILVLFGLLVGPINLFYFAKAGQRHRLFYTTPIISLGASVVLVALILFQDGTGGTGLRSSIVYVNPTAATASIQQAQLSRTGVLFSGAFTTDEPAVLTPVLLSESRWTRLKSHTEGSAQNYAQADDKSHSGDWFQSRSEQAQLLTEIRSTRGRLELTSAPDQPPALRSSFAYPLEEVYFRDANGTLFSSPEPLTTGGTAKLEVCKFSDFNQSLARYDFAHHALLTRPFTSSNLPRGHFFAFTRDSHAEFISTLTSITWPQQQSLVWGPVLTAP